MWAINRVQDVHQDMVSNYEGFLSCLIYSSAHSEFRKAIIDNWQAINDWSGSRLLILVADQVAAEAPPSPSPTMSGLTNMMIKMPGYSSASGTDRTNLELASHFGIKRTTMPCMVFFCGLNNFTAYTYSLKQSSNVIDELMGVFEACDEAWIDSYSENSNLSQHRENMMLRLEPLLARRKLIRFVAKASGNSAFVGMLSALLSR